MTVYVFGSNAIAQLGLGEDHDSTHVPTVLPFFNDKQIRDISCGTIHTLVVTADNKLYSWGCNDEHALGREGDESVPGEVFLPEVPLRVGCGDSISVVITKNNNVYAWGTFRNSNGIYGFSQDVRIQKTPVQIKSKLSGFKFTHVHCGSNFVCLLSKKKGVWTFGSNEFFELGRRTSTRQKHSALYPHSVFSVSSKKNNYKFDTVKCGMNHCGCVNTSGEVYMWGSNIYGQLGTGDDTETKSKHKLDLQDVQDIACGDHHTLLLTKDNKLYGCGRSDQGQLGVNNPVLFVPTLIMEDVSRIRSYGSYSIVQVQNTLYSFGLCFSGATGVETHRLMKPVCIPFEFGDIVDYQVGSNFTVVVTK